MAEDEEIKVRQGQALFPLGVGAVLNYQGQSFIACDTTVWRVKKKIREERLEEKLKVDHFCVPPEYKENRPLEGVPFYRFPRWLFCQREKCRKLVYVKFEDETGVHPLCPECGGYLYPMRFVIACEKGHLSDFPWDFWAHRNHPEKCANHDLRFKVKEGAIDGSLASVIVECKTCQQSNDLEQIAGFSPPCHGTHPWRIFERSTCTGKTKVLQRGASNLRYDFSSEAISIPPFSDFDYWGASSQQVMTHPLFDYVLNNCPDLDNPSTLMMIEKIADETGTTEDTVKSAILSSRGESGAVIPDEDLEYGEYKALKAPDRKHDPRDRFQKRRADLDAYIDSLENTQKFKPLRDLSGYISSIHIVTRLRIVKALTGFTRILRNAENIVPVDLGHNLKWKPAIEYFGEGFFIEFDAQGLSEWTESPAVQERSEVLCKKLEGVPDGFRRSLPGGLYFQPTPKFIFLHTLAHILMLKLQFVAGYSSSAIREKIFCSFPGMDYEMSGILIFTSAGDVEGSMGGVAKMGLPENLMPLLIESLVDATACSYDPVCYESPGQGIDGLNLAACHACALVPETSCNYRNQFLDRAVLVDKGVGIFGGIAEEASNA